MTNTKNRNDDPTTIDARLTQIAQQVLKVPTLAYRNSDALDFHEVSVGQIKLALRAAYEAGRQSKK
jgi:methyl coenzyme M reductase alpha subunit